jgi:hypothetical protein
VHKQKQRQRKKKQQKLERGGVSPEQPIKPLNVSEGAYGNWDDGGVPLIDSTGQELRKNQTNLKIIQMEWFNLGRESSRWWRRPHYINLIPSFKLGILCDLCR